MDLRRPRALLVVIFGLASAACADAVPTGRALDSAVLVPSASLIPSASDAGALPVHRIRAVTTRYMEGSVLDETSVDVSPTDAEWVVTLDVPGVRAGDVIVVYVYLLHIAGDGTVSVQFSGRTDPIEVVGGEAITPTVPIVRGPVENLFTTSVTITSAPTTMLEGTTATLGATSASSAGSSPTVFWTSLDTMVLTLDGMTATAVAPGRVEVVASAGAFADTVAIDVVPVDQIPPTVSGTTPSAGAVAVTPSVVLSALFSERLDPASVNAASFVLRDSVGAQVPATVTYADSVATLTPLQLLDTLHSYTATITTGVTDAAGNALVNDYVWSFSTGAGAVLLSSFDPGLGTLVSIAFDPVSGNLFLLDDFATEIFEYTTQGQPVTPGIPRPGLSSNDIDLDFLPVPATLGASAVPANALLVVNGEANPGTLFAIDKDDGAIIDSIPLPAGTGNSVGGAYHAELGTFMSVDWTSETITEIEMPTGVVLNAFSVQAAGAPTFDVHFGDIEVDQPSTYVLVVSSSQSVVRILTPFGGWVLDVDVAPLGIAGMSGAAWDGQTRTLWVSTTGGMVYQVGRLF